jgi:hypothetical protein
MRTGTKMNSYRLQYWLYAIVATHLGRDVKIERDSLHSRYEVNRHGMYLSSKTRTPEFIEQVVLEILLASGYKIVKDGGFRYFMKQFGTRKATIVLDLARQMVGPTLVHISPHVY